MLPDQPRGMPSLDLGASRGRKPIARSPAPPNTPRQPEAPSTHSAGRMFNCSLDEAAGRYAGDAIQQPGEQESQVRNSSSIMSKEDIVLPQHYGPLLVALVEMTGLSEWNITPQSA